MGAAHSDPRRDLERLYDVQVGHLELDPAGGLAGHWIGRVLHLQREAQPGAGAAAGCQAEKLATSSHSIGPLRAARRAFLFYSRAMDE